MSAICLGLRRETSIFGLVGGLALLGAPALAQDQPAAAPQMEEIVVTGSHIARTNLESTVPVVSLSTAQLQATGITNLADSLNQLPQLGVPGNNGNSNVSSNFSDDGAGVSTINLRNLNQNRTLVLIDGRRTVSGVAVGQGPQAVDISTIPTYLIDHVDIVTGGAGATLGSEAVAGVVNIVLKDHYSGLMMNEQFGLNAEHGDNRQETFDLLTGTSFADDRGQIVFGMEFKDTSQVLSKDRGFAANDLTATPAGPLYAPSSYTLNGGFLTDKGRFTPFNDGTALKYNAARDGFNR